jgi:hypothetical protein
MDFIFKFDVYGNTFIILAIIILFVFKKIFCTLNAYRSIGSIKIIEVLSASILPFMFYDGELPFSNIS